MIRPNGEPVNALFVYIKMLLSMVEKTHYDYIAVCFDSRETTFRKKMYEGYKAQRKAMDKVGY